MAEQTPWFGSHIAHKAKHAAEHAEHQVEHAGKEVAHEAEHEAEKAGELVGEQLEKAVMASLDDIRHLADGLKNNLEKAAYEGKHEIEQATSRGKDDLQKKLHSTEYWLDKHKDDGVKAIAAAGQDAQVGFKTAYRNDMDLLDKTVDAAKADIEKIAKSEAAELTREALQKGLKEAHEAAEAIEKMVARLEDKAPTIVGLLNDQSMPINLGPIVPKYANAIGRIHDIADALGKVTGEDFELTQVFINDLLEGLGPDTISIHADVEFFVEVGLDLDDIPFAAFVEIADLVFDAVGIPKGED